MNHRSSTGSSKRPICPCCRNNFTISDSGLFNIRAKCPMVLPCGHTVCTMCLRLAGRHKHMLCCPNCKQVILLPDDKSYKSLPFNYHLIGFVFANSSLDIDTKFNVTFRRSCLLGTPSRAADSSKPDACSICTDEQASVVCVECNASFCQACYAKSHEENESMSTHRPWPIVLPISKSKLPQLCAEHDDVKMYYCNTDDMLVCAHCTATGAHNGHSVVLLREKNKLLEEDARAALTAAHNVGKCLASAEKTLKKLATAVEAKSQKVASEIHREFSELHAILEYREHELVKDTQQRIEKKSKFISQVIQMVESSNRRLKTLVSDCEKRLSSKTELFDPEWKERLERVLDLPCYLEMTESEIASRIDEAVSRPVIDKTFLLGHSFADETQTDAVANMFELMKIEDVPADALEKLIEDEESEDAEEDVASESMPELENLSDNFTETDDLRAAPETASKAGVGVPNGEVPEKDPLQTATSLRVKPRNWEPMRSEIVHVKYTLSPAHFYVQRVADKDICAELQKCIKAWCGKSNKENTRVESVDIGDLCLAYCKEYRGHYRARVVKMLGSKKGSQANERSKVKVFYIDYGNTEVLSRDTLLRIPPEFTAVPELAIKCSLSEIDPNDTEKGWSRQATKLFVSFTKHIVIMKIHESVGDTLYVDLGAYKAQSRTPASIRDSLVFTRHGFLSHKPYVPDDSSKVLPLLQPDPKLDKYGEPELPPKGAAFSVIVSHIYNPEDFYVQQPKYGTDLQQLMMEMRDQYRISSHLQLRAPATGMVCAAQYRDKNWYRAEVVSDGDEPEQLKVYYVDFGNTDTVERTRVKQLFPRFLIWPKMAIHCRLGRVKPCLVDKTEEHSDAEAKRDWTEDANKYFNLQVEAKTLRAHVKAVSGRQLTVLLQSRDKKKVCVNTDLVEKGYAESDGTGSGEEKDMPLPKEEPDPTAQAEEPNPEGTSPSKTTLLITRITHIVSPDEMYAQYKGNVPEYEALSDALQGVYKNTEAEDNLWAVGDLCAAFDPERKLWSRGRIVALSGEGAAEVFLLDHGPSPTVKTDQLRALLEPFKMKLAGVFRCHLVGITAPGGGKWPVVAIEYLKELASRFKSKDIFMKILGKADNGMPVHVFSKDTKMPGPLEPVVETDVVFADELVEKGLALPIRRSRTRPSAEPEPHKEAEELHLQASTANDFHLDVDQSSATEASGEPDASAGAPRRSPDVVDKQWKPPQPRLHVGHKFNAAPTHVTYEGEVWLHDKDRNGSTLEYVTFSLKEKYEGSQPQSHDLYWYKGQMCIAQFEMDHGWYRAQVLGVSGGMVQVLFVDYGTEETVHPAQLRKEVILENTPQQGFKCDLYGIAPVSEDGRWTKKALDYMHNLVCDKPSVATVMALPEGRNPQISLSVIEDETVENTMVELRYAVRVPVLKVPAEGAEEEDLLPDAIVVPQPEPVAQPLAFFKDLDPVPFGESFVVVVTETLGPNTFYIQRAKAEGPEPSGPYQAAIDADCDELLRYSDWMNAEAERWPTVSGEAAAVGLACCARYADGSWFRAVVVDCEPDGAMVVFYVDYGNVELITVDRLRVLPGELLELPKQAIKCRLHQVAPVDEWDADLEQQLRRIYEAEKLHAVVKSCGNPVQVDLLTTSAASGKMELAYQNLIDGNLIKMVIDKKESL